MTIFRKLAISVVPSSTTTSATNAHVSPSIVVIIVVLAVIFFLSAFLHLLIRCLMRNPALIRRGLRTRGTNGGSRPDNRIVALTALQGQLQQFFSVQDAGLERSLIEELPVFSFQVAMGGLKEGADCAICLCEFVGDDHLRLLPSCGHAFHTDCIDTWLLSHSTCPLCRIVLLPECWLQGSLIQPLLLSEFNAVGEVEHQESAADVMVPMQSGRSGGLESFRMRSSLGHGTVIASSREPTHINPIQGHELSTVEPHVPCRNCCSVLNLVASGDSDDQSNFVARAMSNSARFAGFEHETSQNFYEPGKVDASSEAENHALHATKMVSNETMSSALSNSMISSTSAAAMPDSARHSYTSFRNNTDAQSGRYCDQLEGQSMYGSGRRVTVHLGKCRVVNEQSKRSRKSKAIIGAPRRSYSKGSYEYVIDSSSNLEVLMPSHSKAHAFMSSARLNDLLDLSQSVSSSLATTNALMPNLATGNASQDVCCRSWSPSWANASFRKFSLFNGGETCPSIEEAMHAQLNTLQPLDKPANCEQLLNINEVIPDEDMMSKALISLPPLYISKPSDPDASSAATSVRAILGSDASFSSESTGLKLQELNIALGKHELGKKLESSKRAVSFRLPTASASHHVLSAKLRASASRRALSESNEALSNWEPCLTTEEGFHENDNQMLTLDTKASSHRSSNFAKRTMNGLLGWPRRMVHPVKSATNLG